MEHPFQLQQQQAGGEGEDVRSRVTAAAAELFATRGFAATTIAEIRKATGASASSIYWEFGNKNGILRAVLEDTADRWLEQAHESHSKARNNAPRAGRQPMEASFAHLATEFTERPEFLRLLLLLALEQREGEPETLQAIRQVRARVVAGFAHVFRETHFVGDQVSDEMLHDIATATVAFADGAFVAAQVDPGVVDLRRLFAIFYSGLVAALRVEGPTVPARQPGGSERGTR